MSSTAQRIESDFPTFGSQAVFSDLQEEIEADEIAERMDKRPLRRLLQNNAKDRNVQTYLQLQTMERQFAERLRRAQEEYRNSVAKTKLAERFLLLLA